MEDGGFYRRESSDQAILADVACPYGNTVRVNGQHFPCGQNDAYGIYCGQCKQDYCEANNGR